MHFSKETLKEVHGDGEETALIQAVIMSTETHLDNLKREVVGLESEEVHMALQRQKLADIQVSEYVCIHKVDRAFVKYDFAPLVLHVTEVLATN